VTPRLSASAQRQAAAFKYKVVIAPNRVKRHCCIVGRDCPTVVWAGPRCLAGRPCRKETDFTSTVSRNGPMVLQKWALILPRPNFKQANAAGRVTCASGLAGSSRPLDTPGNSRAEFLDNIQIESRRSKSHSEILAELSWEVLRVNMRDERYHDCVVRFQVVL
jgi:hypothetical protein